MKHFIYTTELRHYKSHTVRRAENRPVGIGPGVVVVTILHTTWEGSGLHLPLSIHTAVKLDGSIPDC